MAEDANARIRVDIDTAAALSNIKNLQRQISAFHTSMAKGGAAAAATSLNMQQGLLNSINQTGKFSATIRNVKSTTDSFTDSLQKNKLSMGEYFRYAGASTKSFGRFFRTEFDTINKVARERVKDLQTQYIKMGRDANGAMRAIAVRPLALDMENLSTKTQIAAQRQALLNQLLKQGSTNLLNFGKNTQWAGRQLMVGFTVPLVMLGSVASKTFMDMEKQAVRFKRVYGELFTTSGQTEKALADIRELANEFTRYGVAVSKTMELAADLAATGKMGAELNAQVAETTRLAILGGVEQAEALQATISLTDAFGVSADELAGKIDFLNAVENQTITSIEDLTIAIPKAGPVVKQLGGDIEDLTFFLTAMREGGINASESANALKSGLASLINPTRQASDMLAGFGINIKGIVEANAGDVKGLVIDFATALDGLDPLNRARAIEQLFGKFQFSRLSTLFQNVIKDGNQASRVLKLTTATQAELAILSEREMKKIEDSPMFKFQKAIEDIKVTLVPLGEAFLKAVTPILEFGTSILKKFDELDSGAKNFVVGLTAIAGVIGPVFLMGFGLIANGVANVVKGFVFFKTAMNKAGSASTQLGMKTEYMTQQQLEASAVAASLDQVHQKLRQTFTSEAIAVNGLTEAYRRAIAAQVAMTGVPITRTRPPKGAGPAIGYASGVLSVPGPKGAGDVVPAMLSPGEAVIPARQAQKYSGFISSMIADNVPGFRFGRNPFAKFKSAVQPEGSKYGIGEGLLRLMTGNRLGPHGSEPNFWQDSIANKFIRSNPKIAVRMQDKDLLSLIGSKDKRYKSVFETKKSNAGDSQKERAYAEEKLFGLPQDIDPSKRPTYGYMFKQERGQSFIGRKQSLFNRLTGEKDRSLTRSAYQNLFKSGTASLMNKKTFRYGNAAMVLKNRNIKDRTTFTYGDSYNRSLDRFGTPAKLGTRNKDQIKASYTSKDKDFFEAQIMGGFTLKDVKKIVVTEPHLVPLLQQALRQQGLKIPVRMPKFTMLQRLRSVVSNARLYGTTLNAQGNRINHRYQNSELPVTQKDGSYGIKEERYIRRRTLNNPPTELNLAARLFQKLGIPGYKDGVFSVPGPKGAGDVVPAMLAPGEAVIPAKQSTKYQDLIKGIVAGNIPGFEDGPGLITGEPTRDRKVSFPESMAVNSGHMASGNRDLTLSQAMRLAYREWRKGVRTGAFDRLGIDAKQVWRDYTAQIAVIRRSGASSIHQYPNLLDTITKTSNVATATVGASGLTAQQHADELARLPRGAFGSGILARLPENHGIPDSELRRYIRNVERSYLSQLQAAEANSPGRRLTEAETNKFYSRATRDSVFQITDPMHRRVIKDSNFVSGLKMTPAIPGGISSSGRTTKWLPSLGGNLQNKTRDIFYGRDTSNFMQRLFGDDFARTRGSRFLDQDGVYVPGSLKPQADAIMKSETLTNDQKARVANQLIDAKNENKPTAKRADRFSNFARILGQSPEAQLASGLDRASNAKSPSKKLVDASAKNMVDGTIKGIEDGKPAATKAGQAFGTAFIDGTKRVRVTEKGQFYNRDTGKRISAAEARKTMALDNTNEKARERAAARRSLRDRRGAGIVQTYGISQKEYDSMSEEKRKELKNQKNLNESIARRAYVAAGEAKAAERQRVANAKIEADEKNQRSLVRRERLAGLGGKVAGGASALGMGAMMYGMSGGPGAEIAGMLALPLMMAPMLTNKFALMAAAVVGLVAAFVVLQGAINKIRKESTETARSLSSGKDAMATFAEAAGTVAPSEYMEKRREMELSPFVVQSGKTTFGQSFVQSEGGAEILESFKKQTELFGRSRAIESLQKQLVTAVATGVLSKEQAQSIAQSLGQQLDDYGITANINASINSITGPDGKVIEGNTIQIYTEFIEESTSGVTGTGGILQTEDLTGGAPIWWWDTEKVAKREGEAAGIIANFYDENQQLIDAFDAENLKKIDVLYDQGKYDEALAAEESYQEERQRLVALYAEQTAQVVSDFGGIEFSKQQGILTGMVDLIKERDPLAGVAAEKLRNSTTDTGIDIIPGLPGLGSWSTEAALTTDAILNYVPGVNVLTGGQGILGALGVKDDLEAAQNDFQEVKVQFLGMLEGGNISTKTFNGLMEMFDPTTGEGQATLGVLAKISTDVGPQALGQLEKVFEALDNPDLAAEIAVRISEIEDPEKAAGTINALEQLATFDGQSIEADVVLEFFGAEENFDKLDHLQNKFAQLDDMAKEGKLNLTTLVEQNIITNGDMAALIEDQEFFDGLEPEQQVKYIQVFLAKQEVIAENEIEAWRTANPELSPKLSDDEVADRIANAAAKQYVEDNLFTDNTDGGDEEDPGGGSGGPAASSLDDLLKKLRDLRKNQIGLTKGFEASAAAINKLFGGGAGINLFSGIENDMRRLGAEEDLISLIVGMSPEDFEKQKNTLFNFDKQTGEIIGFKDQLQNIGRALSAIALGQYVSDQQRSAKESRNQVLAFNQLRAAGYSVADAYEAVQDAAVASAIATGNVTREQINTMLQELKAAQAAMKEAARLTPEGLQEVFEDGFRKAMEAFEVTEKKLTLEYEFKIKDDQSLIQNAENQIATIQYQLDDYEADLKGIEDQEEAINKTYDDKLEALEKVRVANQKVLDQEKGRLSVAEAITRGDLAATARAVQDLRQTSASGYFTSQTDALNAGRQSALDQVRDSSGLSRIEIEEKIKKLTDEIFKIEEDTLEPAQERIRLAGIELQSRIDELKVLGRTKNEWETIKNNIDFARVNSIGYKEAMEEARDVVQQVLDAWNGIQSKTVVLTTIQRTLPEGPSTDGSGDGDGDGGAGNVEEQKNTLLGKLRSAENSANSMVNKWRGEPSYRTIFNYNNITKFINEITDYANQIRALGGNAPRARLIGNSKSPYLDIQRYQGGGKVGYYPMGGLIPYKAMGGMFKTVNTDSVPAMLTPGEFVVRRKAVQKFGEGNLEKINSGQFPGLPSLQSITPPSFSSGSSSVSVNQSSVPSRQAAASSSNSVYNYSLSVNVASQSDPNTIAQTVMAQLQRVDSQRVRNGRF